MYMRYLRHYWRSLYKTQSVFFAANSMFPPKIWDKSVQQFQRYVDLKWRGVDDVTATMQKLDVNVTDVALTSFRYWRYATSIIIFRVVWPWKVVWPILISCITIREQSGGYFVFQQDSAPAHRAQETVALLKRETPAFMAPSLWPPYSPDLNPVDYKIWGVLQNRVYQTRIRNVEHLRERLLEEWSRFDQRIIDGAVNQWRKRLEACVQAKSGHFEHQM